MTPRRPFRFSGPLFFAAVSEPDIAPEPLGGSETARCPVRWDTTDQQTAGRSTNWGLDAVTVQDAVPQTRSIVGVGSGDISSLTVGATIKVASSEFGQRINIYVVGLIEQLLVFKHGERFEFPTRQLPAALPVAQTATAGAEAIQVPILSGYDMRGAKGALFLVGYGTSDADMLAQGKYAVIYVVP